MRRSDVALYLNADEVDSDDIVVAAGVDAALGRDSGVIRYDSCWSSEFVDFESEGQQRPPPPDGGRAAIFHAYSDDCLRARVTSLALESCRRFHHSFDKLNTDPCHCRYSNLPFNSLWYKTLLQKYDSFVCFNNFYGSTFISRIHRV